MTRRTVEGGGKLPAAIPPEILEFADGLDGNPAVDVLSIRTVLDFEGLCWLVQKGNPSIRFVGELDDLEQLEGVVRLGLPPPR
jgi:hypothetical protein